MPSIQPGDMLAERQALKYQLRTEPQAGRNRSRHPQNRQDHIGEVPDPEARKVNRFNEDGVLANDRASLSLVFASQ